MEWELGRRELVHSLLLPCTWGRVADMPTGRFELGCGVVPGSGGGVEVVAVGGVSYGGQQTSAVEIYSVDQDTWRRGKEILSRSPI